MRRQLLIAAGFLALATAALAQSDAYEARLNQAKALRIAGKLDQSQQIVQGVLREQPGNFRAVYTLGLIQLDRGEAKGGVKTLSNAVAALAGKPAPDPTIYNTLGWAQMGLGQFNEAERSFQLGYAYRASLAPASRQKLLNNMSLLYRLKGQEPTAARYLQEAAVAGSPQARVNLSRLKAQ